MFLTMAVMEPINEWPIFFSMLQNLCNLKTSVADPGPDPHHLAGYGSGILDADLDPKLKKLAFNVTEFMQS
jgi:hypothetical protein